MRDYLCGSLKELDTAALLAPRGTVAREHIDLARSQIVSALLVVLKEEGQLLREELAEYLKEEGLP